MRQTILIMLCAVIMVSLLAACSQSELPLTAAGLLDLGEKYLLELNYEQALVQFLAVIEIEPMNPRGYTGAAEAYLGLGREEEAVAVLERGIRSLPGNAEIWGMLNELQTPDTNAEAVPTPSPETETVVTEELDEDSAETLDDGLMTVVGTIVFNPNEYSEQWQQYQDQYIILGNIVGDPRAGQRSFVQSVSIDGYGIRFNNQFYIEIDGNTVLVDEALLSGANSVIGGHFETEALVGTPLTLTGRFSLNTLPEFSGPEERDLDERYSEIDRQIYGDTLWYHYRPNGDYVFTLESYQLLD